ncbi:hypothetical protein GM160_04575 [Guyparkeria halophila]|uniref:Carbonic anhydrase n=1 Tax=Guyparkeria halophila TaxID=47960 RepID=A0A6I6D2T0_9GAMM|nr:carbonic anhydrase family protein [Guyparkeria halophila]QGT78233.1 hypothetical protein GM160_04575 [Guyparkeria halophila]
MRPATQTIAVLITAFSLPYHAMAAEQARWSYEGDAGPGHWASLDPAYSACGDGRNQSPIDITDSVPADQPDPAFDYRAGGHHLVNNGHAVQVDYDGGSVLRLDGRPFELKQFHFHAPSEHTIDGRRFPLEAHLVHADDEGNLAVVAVLFETGDANDALAPIVANLPQASGEEVELQTAFDATALLPIKPEHYRYNGSLTTPPCSEGVRWVVMQETRPLSAAQVQAFEEAIGQANNRPVQPINARMIID